MEEEKVVKKESNFVWGILGFFIPLAGLILFFVWKKDKPQRAKAAIIGFIIYIIFAVVFTLFAAIIIAIVTVTAGSLESTSKPSDYSYTSLNYYDSKKTNNNSTSVSTNTTNTNTNTINTNTISTNTTNTNTINTNTTKTNTTSTNTTSTNTTNTNTTSTNTQRVGDDKFGYITVPSNWYRFIDPDATSTLQYSYANVYIVTLYARDKSEVSARGYAASTMYNMKQEGAENVTGATVTLGKYTAYQVYGYYRSENLWLVCWHFEAEDGKTHYISMEGPDASSEYFKIPETFSLKK
ncbi:MAG: hypothetical protein J6M60_07360 [Clostridia bacterium]|nr:hypothetical protein [Clostridia bacterium]MBP3256281.1 hypothetical protein [Clostridia bacterium]